MRKHRYDKTLGIVNELMLCCYRVGCTKLHLDTDLQPDIATYTVRAPIEHVDEEEFQRIEDILNYKRQPDIEETYWGLGGQSADHNSLQLIGLMVDEAEIRHENGELYISCKRYRKPKA